MKAFYSFLTILVIFGLFFGLYKSNRNAYAYDPTICASHMVQGDQCLSDYYIGLVNSHGSGVAVKDVKRRFSKNAYVASQCHPIMHSIGIEASKKYPNVAEAFANADSFCWSGFYHGILEGVVGRIGEENLLTQINGICDGIPGKEKYNFDYFNCVHGIGHGIMELKGDNLFTSLDICDSLKGDWEQNSCYGGVYMENVMVYNRYGKSDYLKASDVAYPCDAVKDKYKPQCYLNQTSFALELNKYDFTKTFSMCTGVEAEYRDICNQSMGRDAGNQASHDSNRTKELCYIPKDQNDRINCIIGAVKEFVSYYHSDKEAVTFCNGLDQIDRSGCLSVGETYYRGL